MNVPEVGGVKGWIIVLYLALKSNTETELQGLSSQQRTVVRPSAQGGWGRMCYQVQWQRPLMFSLTKGINDYMDLSHRSRDPPPPPTQCLPRLGHATNAAWDTFALIVFKHCLFAYSNDQTWVGVPEEEERRVFTFLVCISVHILCSTLQI